MSRWVKDNVKRLRDTHKSSLVNVTYTVVDRSEQITNRFGDSVPARELQITLVHKRRFSWMIGANLDATFGLVPIFRLLALDLIVAEDRFYTGLDIAVPYRRLLSEPDPKFTLGPRFAWHQIPVAHLLPLACLYRVSRWKESFRI